MSGVDLLAAIIVALVPFNVAVTIYLFYLLGGHPDLVTLRIRAYTQFILTCCSAIGGIFAFAHFFGLRLEPAIVTVLLSTLILLPSAPGVYWVWLYVRDGFE